MERFDQYMERVLYGPDGFYTTGRGVAGRRTGDFITSPEVGPLFGRLIGRWLDSVWDDAKRPARMPVIDLGSGPGTLARAIERSDPRCLGSLEITSVDLADPNETPSALEGSIVIANELLDNIPFRWVRSEAGACTEAFVHNGELVWEAIEIEIDAVGEFPLIEQA
ncbi:MAG: hypothetical protein ACN4GZ_09430, partial [Acidimicrobiales bacterium]